MAKYILKKDLPFAKAGEIIDLNDEGNEYITVRKENVKIDCPLCDIPKEEFYDWIEEVKPREFWVNEQALLNLDTDRDYIVPIGSKYIKVCEVL